MLNVQAFYYTLVWAYRVSVFHDDVQSRKEKVILTFVDFDDVLVPAYAG